MLVSNSSSECESTFAEVFHADTQLCIGKNGKNACNGDSGGPLACETEGNFKVLGIASYVAGSCDVDHPVVYTKVSAYVSWIMEHIKSQDSNSTVTEDSNSTEAENSEPAEAENSESAEAENSEPAEAENSESAEAENSESAEAENSEPSETEDDAATNTAEPEEDPSTTTAEAGGEEDTQIAEA